MSVSLRRLLTASVDKMTHFAVEYLNVCVFFFVYPVFRMCVYVLLFLFCFSVFKF